MQSKYSHMTYFHSSQTNQIQTFAYVIFIGVLEAEFRETDVNVIPITYPFATSHIWWPINHAKEFNIKFDFRSSRTAAILAYSDVTTTNGNGYWEVRKLCMI